MQPLAQKIYQEQNAQQQAGAGAAGATGGAYAGNSGSSDGSDSSVGVEDADYEVVDD